VTDSNDSHDLERFVEAQDPVIEQVKKELRAGRKRSHWMWFVFPQVEGLGKSRKGDTRYPPSKRLTRIWHTRFWVPVCASAPG
jgi:hypothetical protein